MGRPTGVVLAGGAGRRLGRPKGGIRIGGRTLAERAGEVLAPLCGAVVVSVRPGAGSPAPGLRALPDAEPAGRGPLAGILAAFESTGSADLLVLACDYPAVGRGLLEALLAACGPDDDLVFPVDSAGRDHPLVGLWRRALAPAVRDAAGAGRLAVRELVGRARVRRLRASDPALRALDDLDRQLRNVNGPAELEALRRELGG